MASSDTQSVQRALAVLEHLIRSGAATAAELSAQTRLPESTVRRLLRSLQAAGWVYQSRPHQPFAATLKVLEVARSVPPGPLITACARRGIDAIDPEYGWPVAFIRWLPLHGLRVEATRSIRPRLEPARYTVGWAGGAEYLDAGGVVIGAFAAPQVRQMMSRWFARSGRQAVRTRSALWGNENGLRAIRRDGFFKVQSWQRSEVTVAVPVLAGQECLGAIETRVVEGVRHAGSRVALKVIRDCVKRVHLELRQIGEGITGRGPGSRNG
jgi:DNA-binding IclR family transcriptional regulator